MRGSPAVLDSSFDPANWQRGRLAMRAGKVNLEHQSAPGDPLSLNGTVRGSRPQPYRCEVWVEDDGTAGSRCECGTSRCKHAAALLQAHLASLPAPPKPAGLNEFRDALRQAAASVFAADAGALPLVLLLRRNDAFPPSGLLARPFLSVDAKPWAELNPLRLEADQRATLGAAASGWLKLLGEQESVQHAGKTWFRWPAATPLLAASAFSRMHWERPGNTALKSSTTRPLRWEWQADERGQQALRLALQPPGELVEVGRKVIYVDAAASTFGDAIPPSGARMLLPAQLEQWREVQALPPLPARFTPADWSERRPLLPDHVPAPRPLPVQWHEGHPTPVLTLSVRADRQALLERALRRRIGLGELSFESAGEQWSVAQYRRSELRLKETEGVLRGFRFDPDWLESVHQLLDESGFAPAALLLRADQLEHEDFHALNPDFDETSLQLACMVAVPRLRNHGFLVRYVNDFPLALQAAQANWFGEVQADGDWFELELGVELDGERVPLLPVLAKARAAGMADELPGNPEARVALNLDDGRRISLTAGRLRALFSALTEISALRGARLRLPLARAGVLEELKSALAQEDLQWSGRTSVLELGQRLQGVDQWPQVQPPAGLRATLRGYQKEGLRWLQFLRENDLAGVLADDMGLGKTVQLIAHLLVEQEGGRLDRPALVVAPTSVLPNWQAELERFAPGLKVNLLGTAGRRAQLDPGAHVVLASYAYLGRNASRLAGVPLHLLVLDEAQQVKNPNTRAARAVRKLDVRHRLSLTGTPLENHLGELWAQFDFLLPGLLGTRTEFQKHFRHPIEKRRDPTAQQRLNRRIAPFLLRRSKDQVLSELPPKTESIKYIELAGRQRELYELVRLDSIGRLEALDGSGTNRIMVLDALTRLRQICCDPRLLPLSGAAASEPSAKLELLLEMLTELLREGRRILLFSQFTSMLALIEPALRARRIKYLQLTGETRDRAAPVEAFQRGEAPVFLLSLKAGGVGINLTAADTVIHYDPWWNPAVEEQATDRAWRIGQDKPVFVYKLIAQGTVEEKIQALKERKRELLDAIFEGASSEPITEAELRALLD